MYNKIIIAGNLGGDPEMRYMPSGLAVTNFSVATNRTWTDKTTGELQKETTWFRVSVWGRQAEAANQYLSRGRQVLVEGRIKPDPETGGPRVFLRKDGTAGATFELHAENVKFIGNKEDNNAPTSTESTGQVAKEEDDIPF